MSDTKKIQAQLFQAGILNIAFVAILLLAGFFYIYPTYEEISQNVDTLNAKNAELKKLEKDGPTIDQYLVNTGNKTSKKIDPSEKEEIALVLKKPETATMPYQEWLDNEKNHLGEVDAIVKENARVLGNIIPTFTDGLNVNDGTQGSEKNVNNIITLTTFAKYVEEKLLRQFNLDSTSPIGFGMLAFGNGTPDTIASFKLPLEVDGTSAAIGSMIDFIQRSGKFVIKDDRIAEVNQTQGINTQSNTELSALGNLLISIDTVSFNSMLDGSDTKNHASMTLTFYVKGIGYADFLRKRSDVLTQVTGLKKRTQVLGEECIKVGVCKDEKRRNVSASMRALYDDVDSLLTRINALTKNGNPKTVLSDYAELASISSGYQTILNQVVNAEQNK